MLQTELVMKIETHVLCSDIFPRKKSCRLWDNVEKYGRNRQDRKANMAHALYMLDN